MGKVLAIGPYSDRDAAALRDDFDAVILPGLDDLAGLSPEDRAGAVALAYLGHHPLDGAVMDQLPGLRVIANLGVGFDAIDVPAATARGITVTNTPEVLNDDVADLAVALLIAENRRLNGAEGWLRAGRWAQGGDYPLARKMSGRRVGILGLGRIGREIADRMAAFGCPIHYWSRSAKSVPPGWTAHETPAALAAHSDFLVVALVGGRETEGMVSAGVIGAMPRDAVLVNISRGSVIDEKALVAALTDGTIAGAGLDVYERGADLNPALTELPNVLPPVKWHQSNLQSLLPVPDPVFHFQRHAWKTHRLSRLWRLIQINVPITHFE